MPSSDRFRPVWLVCALAGLTLIGLNACGADESAGLEEADPALAGFYSQQIEWADCPAPSPESSECGTLRVPRSYDDPGGEEWKVAVARLPATGGDGKGAIVTNPGGPGISGVSDLLAHSDAWDDQRSSFDVVSFDPRGVGASRPAIDCMTDGLRDAIRNQSSSPGSSAELQEAMAVTRRQVKLCEERNGDLLADVGTRDVARDMDILRASIGQEELNFYGFSGQQPEAVTAAGSGEILVVGVTGDPSTPVQWARSVADSLENGHLLVWNGEGHIASGRGGPCIDDAVKMFFEDGRLPPDGKVCPPV